MFSLRIRKATASGRTKKSFKFRDTDRRSIRVTRVREQGEVNIIIPEGWTKQDVADAEEFLKGTEINWIKGE